MNNNNHTGSDTDDDGPIAPHVVTIEEMLSFGLELAGYKEPRVDRARAETNEERFAANFGVATATACTIYEDMQLTTIEASRIDGTPLELKYFLMALYYLRKYPTESDLEAKFDYSKYWAREMCWSMITKIMNLKEAKIVWPDDLAAADIWVMSVDGTHSWTVEYSHPTLSQDPGKYSHKYHHAGFNYKLGVSLSTNQLIWMAGPFDAGQNDLSCFRASGLRERLLDLGKKALGDGGYNGEPECISTWNAHDSKPVHRFKARAMKRHENFNDLVKVFDATSGRFRHSEARFKVSFEAVCVLCQYKLENEVPLYDILVEAVINAGDIETEECPDIPFFEEGEEDMSDDDEASDSDEE